MKKSNKGITLIALIITIIVMLILVGVTINVALNGGLFEKAKTAGEQTQREADREYLISLITGTLNNTGDFQITTSNLTKDGWKAEETENDNYLKCTSPKNEVFYVNKETGKILDALPKTDDVDIWVGKTFYGIDYYGGSEINKEEHFTITDNETITLEYEMDGELIKQEIKFTYEEPSSSSMPATIYFATPFFGIYDYAEVYVSNNDVVLRLGRSDDDDYSLLLSSGVNSSMSGFTGTYKCVREGNTDTVEFDVVDGYGVYSYSGYDEEFKPSTGVYYILDSYGKCFYHAGFYELQYTKELNETTGEYEYIFVSGIYGIEYSKDN